MAGSGPGIAYPRSNDDDGWISGPSAYDRAKERRDKFLAEHSDWSIVFVRARDVYEASRGDSDSGLDILIDKSLSQLMDRLEACYPKPDDDSADSYDSGLAEA
jgi:hypothetical protein